MNDPGQIVLSEQLARSIGKIEGMILDDILKPTAADMQAGGRLFHADNLAYGHRPSPSGAGSASMLAWCTVKVVALIHGFSSALPSPLMPSHRLK